MQMHNDTPVNNRCTVASGRQAVRVEPDIHVFATLEEAQAFKTAHLARINAQLQIYGIAPIQL
jgi:hypothetical protein